MMKKELKQQAGKWMAVGVSMFGLAASNAFAYTGTNIYGGGVVWSGPSATSSGQFDLSSGVLAPLSSGSPAVTASNIWSWSSSHGGDSNTYASATPITQTLRASSAASSLAGTQNTGSATAAFQGKTVYVNPTGLSMGDPVTLQFTLRVDGTMAVGNTDYPPGTFIALPPTYGYGASASASMRYSVYDYAAASGDVPVLDFQYDASATYGYSKFEYGDGLNDTFSSHGSYTNSTDANGWAVWTDLAGNVAIDNSQSPVPVGVGINLTTAKNVHPVDTGYVVIFVDTFAGHTLTIDSRLSTEAYGVGDLRMTALSDFGSTFDAEITSVTPGVELVGLQAGVAAVPEADTWMMLLAGLGLLGFATGRRRVE
jgi:hypothetical protein